MIGPTMDHHLQCINKQGVCVCVCECVCVCVCVSGALPHNRFSAVGAATLESVRLNKTTPMTHPLTTPTHLVTEESGSAMMAGSPTLFLRGRASTGSCRADMRALISVD